MNTHVSNYDTFRTCILANQDCTRTNRHPTQVQKGTPSTECATRHAMTTTTTTSERHLFRSYHHLICMDAASQRGLPARSAACYLLLIQSESEKVGTTCPALPVCPTACRRALCHLTHFCIQTSPTNGGWKLRCYTV